MGIRDYNLYIARKKVISELLDCKNSSENLQFYSQDKYIGYKDRDRILVSNCKIIKSGELTPEINNSILESYIDYKEIGIDCETYGLNCHKAKIHGVGLSNGDDTHYYILVKGNECNLKILLDSLDKCKFWILHNAKFDRKFLKVNLDVNLSNVHDTVVLAYLHNPQNKLKLGSLAEEILNRYPDDYASLITNHLDVELTRGLDITFDANDKSIMYSKKYITCTECLGQGKIKGKRKNTLIICKACKGSGKVNDGLDKLYTIDYINLSSLANYCSEDCYESVNLYRYYRDNTNLLDSRLYAIDSRLEQTLSNIELRGVCVDTYKLLELEKEIKLTLAVVLDELKISLPVELQHYCEHLNSPKKLLELFNDGLGLGLQSTDKDTLKDNKNRHEFIALLLEYRTLTKLLNSFIIPLLETDGKVYSNFNQIATATGRLASSNPNLQNIPSGDKTPLGKAIRECFIPHDIKNSILCCDYSQFELRILAYLANDEHLIESFIKGEDIHSKVTCLIWGLDYCDLNNPEHIKLRRYTKTLNFGLIYGMGVQKLHQMSGLELDKCKSLISKHKEILPNIWKYLEDCYIKSITQGYSETLFGRRRYYEFEHPYLKKLKGTDFDNYSYLEKIKVIDGKDKEKLRQSANHPIQGTNADVIRVAMNRIDELGYKILMQIHDELVIELNHDNINEEYNNIVDIMVNSVNLGRVPIEVSSKIAASWGLAK